MAVSSVVQLFSGFRWGSLLMSVPLPLMPPWYSSATVGMRTARPVDTLSTHRSLAWYATAALGET